MKPTIGSRASFTSLLTWPDFKARWRRYLTMGLCMALVLAITILLAGFSEGFTTRVDRLLDSLGGDGYVTLADTTGPFDAGSQIPASVADEIAADPGVTAVSPLLLRPTGLILDGVSQGAVIVGIDPAAAAMPPVAQGQPMGTTGEVVVDSLAEGLELGDVIRLGDAPFTVVGRTDGTSFAPGTSAIFMPMDVAQALFANGEDLASTFVVVGTPESLSSELQSFDRAEARTNLVSRNARTKRSISSFTATLWVMAILITALMLYLATMDRLRDLAVLKAIGASESSLIVGIGLQALVLGLAAGLLAIALAYVMRPIYPGIVTLNVAVIWPVLPVSMVLSLLGSIAGSRRAVRVDPTEAFASV